MLEKAHGAEQQSLNENTTQNTPSFAKLWSSPDCWYRETQHGSDSRKGKNVAQHKRCRKSKNKRGHENLNHARQELGLREQEKKADETLSR